MQLRTEAWRPAWVSRTSAQRTIGGRLQSTRWACAHPCRPHAACLPSPPPMRSTSPSGADTSVLTRMRVHFAERNRAVLPAGPPPPPPFQATHPMPSLRPRPLHLHQVPTSPCWDMSWSPPSPPPLPSSPWRMPAFTASHALYISLMRHVLVPPPPSPPPPLPALPLKPYISPSAPHSSLLGQAVYLVLPLVVIVTRLGVQSDEKTEESWSSSRPSRVCLASGSCGEKQAVRYAESNPVVLHCRHTLYERLQKGGGRGGGGGGLRPLLYHLHTRLLQQSVIF